MQVHYVSKLFFGKYAYKVVFHTVTGGNRFWRSQVPTEFSVLDAWCETHMQHNYEITRRYKSESNNECQWHQIVYLGSEQHVQMIIQQFGHHLLEVWKPLDQSHLNSLDMKNIVEVRSTLLYKKYSHAVYFRYDKSGKIHKALRTQLADSMNSKVAGFNYWPIVYSSNDMDVAMIKLSYGDAIQYTKTVRLLPK